MGSSFPWRDRTRFFVPRIFFLLMIAASAAAPSFAQEEVGYTSESLFIALFSDGDALVEYDIGIADPLAEQIRVKLYAENSISNLIVVDYEDNFIEYDAGDSPSEILLSTPGVPNARISYSTQDLVNKIQGRWIFSLNSSSTGFAVRLPPESVLIDPGENYPIIKFVGNQQILTFKPGNVKFQYVIGVLGTEEQANIVIRVAESTIKENRSKYPGIVLTAASDLLQKAVAARDGERFPDAERLATQAYDAAVAAGGDYEAAQKSIGDAEDQIRQATNEGRDTADAAQLLQQANAEFAEGKYVAARNSAEDAIAAIGSKPPEPQMPLFVIVAAAVAAAGGVGAMVILRMRKPRPVPQQKRIDDARNVTSSGVSNKAPAKSPVQQLERPAIEPKAVEPKPQQENEYDASLVTPASTIPESQIDRSILSRIVSRIVEEKPHLRPEDQEVLRYLAEKEGAAFESEIRTKFQLPKTTIWRLVKRLEREELVEIRKAGGQNLIKLMFEDKQP